MNAFWHAIQVGVLVGLNASVLIILIAAVKAELSNG